MQDGIPRLIVLVGPPGSGKSTHAKELKDYYRISQDEMGKEKHYENFLAAIEAKNDIVVDRMNFNREQRSRYIKPAKENGYEIEIIVFHTPKAICLDRASRRQDHPTIKDAETAKKVINFFFQKYEKPALDEGKITIDEPFTGTYGNKSYCVVVDLDGTLCNIDHRLRYVREKPKDWKKFFGGISSDRVNMWCYHIIQAMRNSQYQIIFCSGRGEEYRGVTEDWLIRNGMNGQYRLFMRPAGDSREDSIIKETILDFDILTQYRPLFFIDDRKRVVDMWRRRGFTVLHCAEGNF